MKVTLININNGVRGFYKISQQPIDDIERMLKKLDAYSTYEDDWTISTTTLEVAFSQPEGLDD